MTVVAEVKTLRHVNGVAEPLGKVWVVDPPFLLRVFVDHELLELVVVQVSVCSEVLQDVFDCDEAIKVGVQSQEGLPHRLIAIGELCLEFVLKLLNSLLYNLVVLLSMVCDLLSILLCIFVGLVVSWVLYQVQMWEEVFLEDVEVEARAALAE